MTAVEQAAYLKGLADALVAEKPEYKLWSALCDLVSNMAHQLEDLQSASLEQAGAIDELGDELLTVQGVLYDMDESDWEYLHGEDESNADDDSDLEADEHYTGFLDDDADLSDDEPEDNLYHLSDAFPDAFGDSFTQEPEDPDEAEEDDLSPEDILYDITCPSCGMEITIDEAKLSSGSMNCPYCGEILEFEGLDTED